MKNKRIIYENEPMSYGFVMGNIEFRTPEDMKDDPRFAVKRLREIVFYLTDHHLIRERIHHIDGSEYTVRSEFARKTEGSMDAMIQRLVETEAPTAYKNIVKIPA